MALDVCSKNYERGILLCDVGRYAEGLRSFNKAKECLDETNADHKQQHALILIAKGGALNLVGEHSPQSHSKLKYKDALKCFDKAIEILQQTGQKEYLALAFHNKGYTHGNMREYEEASKFLGQALTYYEELNESDGGKFNAEHANTLRSRGFVTAMLNWDKQASSKEGYDKAIEDLDRAIRIDPSLSIAYNTKGYVYEIFGEYENAKKWFDRAIKRDPYLAVAWYNKGYVTFEMENNGNFNDGIKKKEKYQEAIKYIDNAIIIDPKISYEWYYKGCVLYRGLRKYQEALKCFDKALEIDPNFAYAWYNKGLVLIELENYREAIECFDGAVKCLDSAEKEKIALVLFGKATALDSLGEKDETYYLDALNCFGKVIEIFEDIRRNNPNNETRNDVNTWLALSYQGKGFTYGNLKQYKDALEWFSRALTCYHETYKNEAGEVRREYTNTLRNMGFVHSKLYEYEKAEQCFMESVTIDPGFGYAWNSKGFYTLEHHSNSSEKLTEAVIDFDKAIKCFEEDKNTSNLEAHIFYPYYYKGRILYLLKDYDAAIKCFDNSLRIRPDDIEARFGKGLSYYSIAKENSEKNGSYEMRLFEEAIKCFDESIQISPCYLGWYYKAVTLYSMKRYEEAAKSFEETTKLRPDDVYAWYYKALALYSATRYAEAVQCFDVIYDTFKRKKNNDKELVASILCYKGNANYWLGKNNEADGVDDNDDEIQERYQTAVECHDEALNLFSNGKGSKYGLNKSDILFDRGVFKYYQEDFSSARLDFEAAAKEDVTLNSKKSRIHNNIGLCYFKAGKKFYEEAEKSFFDAINIDSTKGIAYYNLAALYCKENKIDKAKDLLEESNTKHPLIKEAKEKLKDKSDLDWYNWWFSQSKIKKAMGIMLISALLVPFIGTAIVIYQGSSEGYRTIYNIFSEKAEILISGFITIIAIIVGILLLPSLHKLKVGTAIELEKDSPRFADSNESSFMPKIQFVPNVTLPELPKFRIPIEKPNGKDIMPLKYQRQRLFMPIAICNMPTRMLI